MHFGKLICTGFQLEGPNPLGHGPISSVRYLYFVCIRFNPGIALASCRKETFATQN